MSAPKSSSGMERRSLLKRIGLGGLAAAAASLIFQRVSRADETSSEMHLVGFFNGTSDWMNGLYLMNENPVEQEITVSLFNLPGELILEETVSIAAWRTLIIPLETLPDVKGKQGMVVIVPTEGLRLAASILYRRASQPDHTAEMVPCSPTTLS